MLFETFSVDRIYGNKVLIGQYALPINCIRQGYRVVPLRNTKFRFIADCFLFARISVFDVV
jgi:hypothetical protein